MIELLSINGETLAKSQEPNISLAVNSEILKGNAMPKLVLGHIPVLEIASPAFLNNRLNSEIWYINNCGRVVAELNKFDFRDLICDNNAAVRDLILRDCNIDRLQITNNRCVGDIWFIRTNVQDISFGGSLLHNIAFFDSSVGGFDIIDGRESYRQINLIGSRKDTLGIWHTHHGVKFSTGCQHLISAESFRERLDCTYPPHVGSIHRVTYLAAIEMAEKIQAELIRRIG